MGGGKRGPNGRIIIPSNADIWEHELSAAKRLASTGRDIEFLPRIEGREVKTADILMDGIAWEMKSPESSNLKSLQRILRRAGKQSPNVLIDVARMHGVPTPAIDRELRRLKPLVRSIRRLRLLTREGIVVDIP